MQDAGKGGGWGGWREEGGSLSPEGTQASYFYVYAYSSMAVSVSVLFLVWFWFRFGFRLVLGLGLVLFGDLFRLGLVLVGFGWVYVRGYFCFFT